MNSPVILGAKQQQPQQTGGAQPHKCPMCGYVLVNIQNKISSNVMTVYVNTLNKEDKIVVNSVEKELNIQRPGGAVKFVRESDIVPVPVAPPTPKPTEPVPVPVPVKPTEPENK